MAALRVYSEDSAKCQLPSLVDATSDELLSGLKQGLYTSVDLVNVSFPSRFPLFTPKKKKRKKNTIPYGFS